MAATYGHVAKYGRHFRRYMGGNITLNNQELQFGDIKLVDFGSECASFKS